MRHANHSIANCECHLQQFVCDYSTRVCKPEQWMVSEHSLERHRLRVEHHFVRECWERRVAVDYVYAFANQNASHQRKCCEECGKSALIVYNPNRQIIHFQTRSHISHTRSVVVWVSDDYHFMSVRYETLWQLIDMTLDAASVGVEKVRCHTGMGREGKQTVMRTKLQLWQCIPNAMHIGSYETITVTRHDCQQSICWSQSLN